MSKTVEQRLIKTLFADNLVSYNKVSDGEDFNPCPGAHRSTAFHPLFDLLLLGIIAIQGFHPSGQWAAVGREKYGEQSWEGR